MMRIVRNVTTGRICIVNVTAAVIGLTAIIFSDGVNQQIYASGVGVYFFLQAILARIDMRRARK